MSLPPGLLFYRCATTLAGPLAHPALHFRVKRGKEDALRIDEREGRALRVRPAGRLVWLHGASVGESRVILTLVKALSNDNPRLNFLVTTGTMTSAAMMDKALPSQAIHQYVPIDRPLYVRRFLDYWQPDLGVFVESELWPNLLLGAQHRGIPLALVNARMNSGSMRGWMSNRSSAVRLLRCFSWIGAADQRTADGLSDILRDTVPMVGNLKIDAEADPVDPEAFAPIIAATRSRHVWVAASTHPGEDEIVLDAHRKLLAKQSDALLILVPRHPERGDAVSDLLASRSLAHARRSQGERPDGEQPVWLADTLGEMRLWLAATPAAFIGGSLFDGIGGHNPVEATQSDAAVITGPYTASFDDVFAAYEAQDAVVRVQDADRIAQAVTAIWNGQGASVQAGRAAVAALSSGALSQTMKALRPMLTGTLT
ncbi:MAG: 3-deoxy-D-manno-octulosonic acid transferase [Maricaulis sp.]|nr:3-deoxy-D-manno-octulosonic acid transferase [Maricaulis sp.]HAQ36022.1 3-deoxy-D-manno-octulosonic acid transferase [Alphaproteobacteria bacterium]